MNCRLQLNVYNDVMNNAAKLNDKSGGSDEDYEEEEEEVETTTKRRGKRSPSSNFEPVSGVEFLMDLYRF